MPPEFRTKADLKRKLLDNREIDPETNCWIYTAQWHSNGYGRVNIVYYPFKRMRQAHCVAAHLWRGLPLICKNIIYHKCDNPACFNPKHLKIFEDRRAAAYYYHKHEGFLNIGEDNSQSRMTLEQARRAGRPDNGRRNPRRDRHPPGPEQESGAAYQPARKLGLYLEARL
jgi:hypothetical protein